MTGNAVELAGAGSGGTLAMLSGSVRRMQFPKPLALSIVSSLLLLHSAHTRIYTATSTMASGLVEISGRAPKRYKIWQVRGKDAGFTQSDTIDVLPAAF